MEINSSIARVDHSTKQLFSKLSSVETYEGLMPEGATFSKIDDSRFRFKLGGMPEIGLTIGDKQPNESIVLTSSSDKITFSLRGQLTKISETQTDVQLKFEGDFNPMMAMICLLYTSPSPRDKRQSRMPSSA